MDLNKPVSNATQTLDLKLQLLNLDFSTIKLTAFTGTVME
jgi:hypothetical protein